MISIDKQKAKRRERLADLLKEVKPATLVNLLHTGGTPISAALLYQMSRGTGKSLRNANDSQARAIERAVGKPVGWLDGVDEYPMAGENIVREPVHGPARGSPEWIARLTNAQALLRETMDAFLPMLSDQQANAVRQIILALRLLRSAS